MGVLSQQAAASGFTRRADPRRARALRAPQPPRPSPSGGPPAVCVRRPAGARPPGPGEVDERVLLHNLQQRGAEGSRDEVHESV